MLGKIIDFITALIAFFQRIISALNQEGVETKLQQQY